MGMLKVTQTEDGFCLRQNPLHAILMLFVCIMLFFYTAPEWIEMIPKEGEKDYIGFALVSLLLVIALSILVSYTLRLLFARIDVTHQGIFYSSLFRKKNIPWSELKDYGISADKRSKHDYVYALYFSDKILPEKNSNKKKLKGVTICLDMTREDYAGIYKEFLPYCSRYTGLKPFLPARLS